MSSRSSRRACNARLRVERGEDPLAVEGQRALNQESWGDAIGGLLGGYRGGYTGGLMQAVVTGILAGENAAQAQRNTDASIKELN